MEGHVSGSEVSYSAERLPPVEGRGQLGSVFAELKPPLNRETAVYEAFRCLYCGSGETPAPCTAACPSAVDVPAFIGAIAHSEFSRAGEIVFRDNPLGGSCARVCPVEELCEGACVLEAQARRPVSIGRLQRFAADAHLADNPPRQERSVGQDQRRLKVSVVGAGPAGMACAERLSRWGYSVTVYDARPEPGGLVRYAIAPYRLMQAPLLEEMKLMQVLGVEFRFRQAIADEDAVRRLTSESDAVFLGVGLGQDVAIEYPGDDLDGIWQSLQFIEQLKTGHPPAVGKRVVVIGGGNTAIDVAREALRLGADEVTLAYRRTKAEMPAYRQEVADAEQEGVRFRWLTAPVGFVGQDRVEFMQCQSMRLTEADETGRRHPEPMVGSEFLLPVDTVILAVGQQRRHEWQQWVPDLDVKGGLIVVNPSTGQTSNPKFFAGGDGVNGGATVVEAVAMGKLAAEGIHGYLEPNEISARVPKAAPSPTPLALAPQMTYRQGGASLSIDREWCKGCNLCVDDCPVHTLALDDSELVYVKDMSLCVLCGICAVRCPDFVFTLDRADPISGVDSQRLPDQVV